MNIGVILITLIVTATMLYFNVYRYDGYKISIGGNTITYVKSKGQFNRTYNQLKNDINFKYKNVVIKNDFTLEKTKVGDVSMFLSGNNLKNIIMKKFNISMDGFLMKSDNRKLSYVASESQGKEILNSVKKFYAKEAKLSSITKIEIVNNITYVPLRVKMINLFENNDIVGELIKYNTITQIPFITIKIVGNISKSETIYRATIIKSSSSLMAGVNKTEHEGKNGTKKVITEVTELNDDIVSRNVVREEIITPVQNKEVSVGNSKPIIVGMAYMNSPSRGSISSGFGMRWGKMHKGIDIAASLGASINSVLAGIVTFTGWQEGYGNVIIINHGEGLETAYAHCSVISVKRNEAIKLGEKIGEVGSTGHSTGPHLHFEVRENGVAINPQKYIK
jgi:murein DD-endopeptidase MepM/ murein hydrolase activator NlpD